MIPEIPPALLSLASDAPLAALMLWMLRNLRRDMQAKDTPPTAPPTTSPAADGKPPETARDELAAFKLEVARTYVPLSLIRDLDSRLSLHLVRIEEKLDEVSRAATAAAAVSGQPLPGRRIGFSTRGEADI